MTVNLHTHTYRCGHSKGTEREYIETAIAGGITHMGFSDHAPFLFPDGHESKFRVPMAEAEDYMTTLRALREEYRDQIRIHIGFEMEYYPCYFKEMLQTVTDLGAEYLILGQHYVGDETTHHTSKPGLEPQRLVNYVDSVIEAMETGVFTYVAHPDVLYFLGDEDFYEEQMRRLCAASVRYALPLEINFLGLRDGRQYPNKRFWKIAGGEGCQAVFGMDAHRVAAAYDAFSIPLGEYLVKENGLKLVTHPTLIHPLTKKKTTLEG